MLYCTSLHDCAALHTTQMSQCSTVRHSTIVLHTTAFLSAVLLSTSGMYCTPQDLTVSKGLYSTAGRPLFNCLNIRCTAHHFIKALNNIRKHSTNNLLQYCRWCVLFALHCKFDYTAFNEGIVLGCIAVNFSVFITAYCFIMFSTVHNARKTMWYRCCIL